MSALGYDLSKGYSTCVAAALALAAEPEAAMPEGRWPFTPDHITNDGARAPAGSPLRKLAGTGIITNEHLQGIQTVIATDLKIPTTMIEFSPICEPVRTDSRALGIVIRPPSKRFRDVTGARDIDARDNDHALLFCHATRSNIREALNREMWQSESKIVYRNIRNPEVTYEVEIAVDRSFLQYDCPYLGYRELIFPVFFEDRVIAAFFVGELALEYRLDHIRHWQSRFLAQHPHISAAVQAEIEGYHRRFVDNPENVVDDAEMRHIINATVAQLRGFEETLEREKQHERDRFVQAKVTEYTWTLYETLPKELSPGERSLEFFWKSVQEKLAGIVEDFSLRYVVVFGIERLTMRPPTELGVTARAGNLADAAVDALRLNLEDVDSSVLGSETSSAEHPELFGGLIGRDQLGEDAGQLMSVFPLQFYPELVTAILIGLPPRDDSATGSTVRGLMELPFQAFYRSLQSALSGALAVMSKNHLEMSLRVLGHEIAQLITQLNGLRVRHLATHGKIRAITDVQAKGIDRDVRSVVELIDFQLKAAGMVVDEPDCSESFWPYDELLLRWKDLYYSEAEKKCLQFATARPERGDEGRPEMFGDKKLLIQIVYSLVNNAVKYAHRGTKIHLGYRVVDEEGKSFYVISVTNYGIRISDDEHVRELFTRGDNVEGTEGMGIGLYIADLMARAHGGEISWQCDLISPYNVTLISHYLRSDVEGKDPFILEALGDADTGYLVLEDVSVEDAVAYSEAGVQRYLPTDEALLMEIDDATYRVTMSVRIPRRERAT